MGILTLEDLTGQIEGLVFPKIYEKVADQLDVDQLVILARQALLPRGRGTQASGGYRAAAHQADGRRR